MAKILDRAKNSGSVENQVPLFVALFVAVLALFGTIAAAYLSFKTAERASDIRMIEMAVGVLRAPISEDLATIRGWAMDIIDLNTSRKFTPEERSALLKKSLPFTPQAETPSLRETADAIGCMFGPNKYANGTWADAKGVPLTQQEAKTAEENCGRFRK